MKKALILCLCVMLAVMFPGSCALADGYTIQCLDQNGEPVRNVLLTLCNPSSCRIVRTDDDGKVTADASMKDLAIVFYSIPEGYELAENDSYLLDRQEKVISFHKLSPNEGAGQNSLPVSGAADTAERFTFASSDLYGNPVDESMMAGYDLVFINFWETWCGPCKEEMPELEKTYEALKDKGVLFIGVTNISPDDGKDPKDVLSEMGITYPVINFSNDFMFIVRDGMISLPTSMIIGKDGRPVFLTDGELALLFRNLYNRLAEAFEAQGDTENAAICRSLANVSSLPEEVRADNILDNGAFTFSQLNQELLEELFRSVRERQ